MVQVWANRVMSSVARGRNNISKIRSAASVPGRQTVDQGEAAIEGGRKHLSGEYLHQKGRVFQYPTPENKYRILVNDGILRKEMLPVLPLVALVILAGGLGIMTFYRSHLLHPNTTFRKKRRGTIYEIEEPDEVEYEGKRFKDSPLRKLSLHSRVASIAHIQQEPPKMAGIKAEGHI